MAEALAAAEQAQAEDRIESKVTVTDAGPCRKKLAIEIPASVVEEQIGDSLDTVAVEADVPGFRRGRAPKRLIQKKFGTAVRREAKNQLVATAYSQAVEDNKLKVIGDPISDGLEDVEIEEGKALTFEVDVEVLPEFELPKLDGIEILKPTLELKDEQVDEEFKRLAMNEGTLAPREASEPGDYLTGHAKMTGKDGTVHLEIPDAVIQVPPPEKEGKGMILGIMVEDFATQVGSPKPGDVLTITTTGPENHEVEAIRGDDLTIEFTVGRVDRIIPAAGEDLAAKFGMETEAEVREALKARMQQRVQVEQQTAMRRQAARYLLENIEMEMPERVTAQQAERTLARRRWELMNRGVSEQQIEEHIAELRSATSESAVNDLKMFFTLNKAAEDLDVKVTENEMNGWIAQLAIRRGMRPEKLRQQLIQNRQAGQVYQQIREQKTLDAIVAKAKVEEVSAEEFNKRFSAEDEPEAKQGGEGGGEKKKTTSKKKTTTKKKAE